MERKYFKSFDFSNFWDNSEYAKKKYVEKPVTDKMIKIIEKELGYKLPTSYIEMMKVQNGGIPVNVCFPAECVPGWPDGFVQIDCIMGIGNEKRYSLGGEAGSKFWIDLWEYPDIGVVICETITGGHDLIMLDYRKCGNKGEPEVVHVDQEGDYEITFLAKDFETFIKGLVNYSVFDTTEEDKIKVLKMIEQGKFSELLSKLVANITQVNDIEGKIRFICTQIVNNKDCFALHDDELSYLMYDLQFWLYSNTFPNVNKKKFIEDYPKMIAFGGDFSTGGYGPSFFTDWLDDRIQKGIIVDKENQIYFSERATADIIDILTNVNQIH